MSGALLTWQRAIFVKIKLFIIFQLQSSHCLDFFYPSLLSAILMYCYFFSSFPPFCSFYVLLFFSSLPPFCSFNVWLFLFILLSFLQFLCIVIFFHPSLLSAVLMYCYFFPSFPPFCSFYVLLFFFILPSFLQF